MQRRGRVYGYRLLRVHLCRTRNKITWHSLFADIGNSRQGKDTNDKEKYKERFEIIYDALRAFSPWLLNLYYSKEKNKYCKLNEREKDDHFNLLNKVH